MPPRTRQARKGAVSRRRRGQYYASKRKATSKRSRGRIARSPRGAGHSGSGYINRRSAAWRRATGRAIDRNR